MKENVFILRSPEWPGGASHKYAWYCYYRSRVREGSTGEMKQMTLRQSLATAANMKYTTVNVSILDGILYMPISNLNGNALKFQDQSQMRGNPFTRSKALREQSNPDTCGKYARPRTEHSPSASTHGIIDGNSYLHGEEVR